VLAPPLWQLFLGGQNIMGETLAARRELLSREVLPLLADPVREAPRFDAALADLIAAVRAQGLEDRGEAARQSL
jgi:hypothetical protein